MRPRIEVLDPSAGRLEAKSVLLPLVRNSRLGTASLTLGGATLLAVGVAGLSMGNYVADQFARGPVLGWVTLAVALGGFGLIGLAGWRELRGLLALRTVDRLRVGFADPASVHETAQEWLADLPGAELTLAAIRTLNDPDGMIALLRQGPQAVLRAQSEALGRAAALQIFAATAAIPSPALDGMLVAWRGVRLVREIASLHGMRPGLFGTISLLKRTMLSAAAVAATDLAADASFRMLISNRLAQHVAGDVAAAGVAARRMIVLARSTCAACDPLPPR